MTDKEIEEIDDQAYDLAYTELCERLSPNDPYFDYYLNKLVEEKFELLLEGKI